MYITEKGVWSFWEMAPATAVKQRLNNSWVHWRGEKKIWKIPNKLPKCDRYAIFFQNKEATII